jgi:hypothetical protein
MMSSSANTSWQNISRRITYRHVAVFGLVSILLLTFYHFSDSVRTSSSISDTYGGPQYRPPPQIPSPPTPTNGVGGPASKALWAQRAQAVKDAFVHSYRGYRENAAPHDEILPVTGGSIDKCVEPKQSRDYSHLLTYM